MTIPDFSKLMCPVPITPTPPVIEVRIVVERIDHPTVLMSQWEPYSMAEFQDTRGVLATEVGSPDGAVSIWTSDTTTVIVPSRNISTLSISTRPITPDESS